MFKYRGISEHIVPLAFILFHAMNFPIFEHYMTEEPSFPRSKIIQVLEKSPNNDHSDIDLTDEYIIKQISVNQKVKLVMVYQKDNLPDDEEMERMRSIAIRVTQGDKLAINHVISSFMVPM